jgi:hypothetical protein
MSLVLIGKYSAPWRRARKRGQEVAALLKFELEKSGMPPEYLLPDAELERQIVGVMFEVEVAAQELAGDGGLL